MEEKKDVLNKDIKDKLIDELSFKIKKHISGLYERGLEMSHIKKYLTNSKNIKSLINNELKEMKIKFSEHNVKEDFSQLVKELVGIFLMDKTYLEKDKPKKESFVNKFNGFINESYEKTGKPNKMSKSEINKILKQSEEEKQIELDEELVNTLNKLNIKQLNMLMMRYNMKMRTHKQNDEIEEFEFCSNMFKILKLVANKKSKAVAKSNSYI